MRRLLASVLLVGLLFGSAGVARAQDKEYHWVEIAVDLAILPNGDVRVEERQTLAFTAGSFTRVYRDIRLQRLEGIDQISVSEGTRTYRQGSGRPGEWASSVRDGTLRIEWWFEPTERATRTFTLGYTVHGIVRRYDVGDQVWWKAIGSERSERVERTVVTARLPAPVAADQLLLVSYGAPTDGGRLVDPWTVRFVGGAVAPGQELEVRLQFPRGLVGGTKPAWQDEFDRQRAFDQQARPLVNFAVAALSLLGFVGGLVWIALRWASRGADPRVGPLPGVLDEPPDDLPPGLVGVLLDERADVRDFLATILDLARRGFLVIEELPPAVHLMGLWRGKPDYRLSRGTADWRALRVHEKAIVEALFSQGADQVDLSALNEKFYKHLPKLRAAAYDELVLKGLMPDSPERVRTRYTIAGIALIILAGAGAAGALPWLAPWTDLGWLPLAALGGVGLAVVATSRAMPRRTREGALEAGRWRAFKRHLEEVARGGDERISSEIFERYLPYATAFGLQQAWLRELGTSNRVEGDWTPSWYRCGRSGGSAGATDGQPGRAAGQPSIPSLQQVSNGLAGLLNDASTALTSSPDGGGGGGGSDGGGGSGGGGGGAS